MVMHLKIICFFSQHPDAIRLHLYLDEFEVCNPIGAQRNKHKVLAVYYFVGNMDKLYWSQSKFIHLCLLVRYKFLKDCDPYYHSLFLPLIDELDVLASDGIDVLVDGVSHNFRAAVATVSGDNLSAHALAGFQRHFHAGRICRYCMANHDEIGSSFSESNFTLRVQSVHAYHLEALESNVANGPVYGVLHKCPLLALPYFDVTTAFAPDLMHDLLEGVIPNLIHKLINHFVKAGTVTVDDINFRLTKGKDSSRDQPNKITQKTVSNSGSITGSAAQKWRFFLILPRIIGVSIQEGDATWEIYLLLRQVCDIVFAHVVQGSCLTYLNDLVIRFLSHWAAVFGANTLTPKHHFMIHYSRLIGLYGPLRHLWCMRFEGKHSYFKSVISSVGNYINVSSTMANRHQMRQCWEFSGNDVLGCEPQAVTQSRQILMSDLPVELVEAIDSRLGCISSSDEVLTVVNELQINHTIYVSGKCMVLDVVEEEQIPLFLKIVYITRFRDTWLLCGRLCFSQRFNRHLHAFEVMTDKDWAVVYPGEEVDYNMLTCFFVDGCCLLSCMYNVAKIPPY